MAPPADDLDVFTVLRDLMAEQHDLHALVLALDARLQLLVARVCHLEDADDCTTAAFGVHHGQLDEHAAALDELQQAVARTGQRLDTLQHWPDAAARPSTGEG